MKKLFLLLSLFVFFIGCSEKKSEVNKDSKLPLNFEKSSIRYYQKIFEKRFMNCDDSTSCVSINITYPEIINSGSGIDSINSFIKSKRNYKHYFGCWFWFWKK